MLEDVGGIAIRVANCVGLSILADLVENAMDVGDGPTPSRSAAA